MSQTEQTKKDKYVRVVTRTKANQYMSVAIPTKLSKQLNLDHKSYMSVYIDQKNNLVFQKLEV